MPDLATLISLASLASLTGLSETGLLVAGIATGLLLAALGVGALLTEQSPAAERIAALRAERRAHRADSGRLIRAEARDPVGLWRAVIPTNLATLTSLASLTGLSETGLLVAGIATGLLLAALGVGALLTEQSPAADRIAALRAERRAHRADSGRLIRAEARDPVGLWRAVIPTNLAERTALSRKLAAAGMTGPHALRRFTLVRIGLGLGLPAAFAGLVALARTPGLVPPPVVLPPAVWDLLGGMTDQSLARITVVLVAIGYFAPAKWLSDRAEARRRKIEEAFPTALDLMQISVEAGLGFDAAMTRVGNELAPVSPELAFEFLTVQRQVQAGRTRAEAMSDMALRSGVDAMRSFAGVVAQSMQFGTSMAEALTAYAHEMRQTRELRAQEAANKLPVKMSGVLATLMLPALILLTVGPVAIRYLRFFESL